MHCAVCLYRVHCAGRLSIPSLYANLKCDARGSRFKPCLIDIPFYVFLYFCFSTKHFSSLSKLNTCHFVSVSKKFLFYSFYIFCCIFTFVLQINSSKKCLHMQSCCFPYYPFSFWRSRFRRRRVCLISEGLNRPRLWVCLTFINWLLEILTCSFFRTEHFHKSEKNK